MKKRGIFGAFCGFILVAALALPAAPARLTFRLSAGPGHFLIGDFNAYLEQMNQAPVSVSDLYEFIHGGFEAGGEIVFWLTPAWGIGLGADFIRIARPDNREIYSYASMSYHYLFETTATAWPVQASVHIAVRPGRRLSGDIRCGLALIWARWANDYSYEIKNAANVATYTYRYNDEASAIGLGFHGGAALSWNWGKHISIVGEALLRWAPTRGFSGLRKNPDARIDNAAATIEGKLYAYEYSPTSSKAWFSGFTLGGRPVGEGVRNVREATVDFSGAVFRIGLAIHL